MAPRRKRHASVTSRKQSSISDFFAPNPRATAQPRSFLHSTSPKPAIKRPRRNSARLHSARPVKREALPRNVKRITADTFAAKNALSSRSRLKPTANQFTANREINVPSAMQSQPHSQLTRHTPNQPGENKSVQPTHVHDASSSLTNEELFVQEALRSLECSQDHPETHPPRDATSCSQPSKSSSEDSDEELAKLEMIRASRRSGRTSNPVQRFDPSHVPETSVFGPVKLRSGAKGDIFRNPDTYLAKLLRERNARARDEDQLQQMREDVEKPTQAQQDEQIFASMAKSEREAEEKLLAAIRKYSAPVPLFCHSCSIPEIPARYLVRGGADSLSRSPLEPNTDPLDYFHDMLVDVVSAGESGDRALSTLIPTLAAEKVPAVRIHPVNYRIVFFLAVFDRTSLNSRSNSRDDLVDTLVCMVENELHLFKSAKIKLPTLMNTLHKYGATMSDWSAPHRTDETEMHDDALDSQVPNPDKTQVSDDFKRALRNLKRACRIAAGFVRLGIPLTRAIGVKSGTTAKEVLCALGIAVRILESAFGNRLYCEVGEIIIELLKLIPDTDWPQFRLEAAKYLLLICDRLELHVELVAHLIPQKFERSRYLALDLGFLSFAQWCHGPSHDPVPHPVDDYQPSAQAKKIGLKTRSYCLADIANLLKLLPEIDKNTCCEWAWLISYQMRLILSEPALFQKCHPADLSELNEVVQRLRTCTNRLAFEPPVQHMRIELDTLLKTYRAFGLNSRDNMAAILPNLRAKKQQATLDFGMKT